MSSPPFYAFDLCAETRESIMAIMHHQLNHIAESLQKSLVLVGHMGSGKSNVGRLIAQQLGLGYDDSDKKIEKVAGISIVDIFELYGEDKFRELELREINALLGKRPLHVISVGGGAFVQPDCHAAILEKGFSIWLQASPETLVNRISNFASRPLLKDRDPLEVLTQLSAQRDAFYEQADLVVNTDGLEIPESVDKVLSALDAHFSETSSGSSL